MRTITVKDGVNAYPDGSGHEYEVSITREEGKPDEDVMVEISAQGTKIVFSIEDWGGIRLAVNDAINLTKPNLT